MSEAIAQVTILDTRKFVKYEEWKNLERLIDFFIESPKGSYEVVQDRKPRIAKYRDLSSAFFSTYDYHNDLVVSRLGDTYIVDSLNNGELVNHATIRSA